MRWLGGIIMLVSLVAAAATPEEEAARVHFLSGQAYYDQADYEDALREFGEAYRISHKPQLLYNLAVCHEHLSHFAEAIALLEQYLAKTPDASDRAAVLSRIRTLKELEKRSTPPPSPAPTLVAAKPAAAPPSSAPRRRVATWLVGGLGLGLLAGALASGVVAQLRYNSLVSDCGGDFACSIPQLEQRKSQGRNAAIATDVLWPIGTAAIVAAVVLYVFEGKPSKVHAAAGGLSLSF
jgi:tetratricopeptide (TPR) repeat protein